MDAPHLGVVLPNYGDAFDPGRLAAAAAAAEEAGLDSGWMTDHVLVPSRHARIYGTITEALVTTAFLAGRTERLRLGVSALIVPQREPLLTLKQLVSLDLLSRGRLITAVAAGWMEEEFETLGASFSDRGRRLDEWLDLAGDLLRQAPGRVLSDGPVPVSDAWLAPAPTRPEGLELWVAGVSRHTLRRAATTGVWHPVALPLRELRAMAASFRDLVPEGRSCCAWPSGSRTGSPRRPPTTGAGTWSPGPPPGWPSSSTTTWRAGPTGSWPTSTTTPPAWRTASPPSPPPPPAGRSPLAHGLGPGDPVTQVGDPVALDDLGVAQEQGSAAVVAEVADPGPEHHRDQVDQDLVDQAGLEGLAADVAGVTETTWSPASSLAWATALATPSVTKVKGASGKSQSSGGRWVTTNTASPTGGRPFQPLVMSNSRRPMTPATASDQARRRYSALAAETRNTRSGSAPVTSTSPLPYQSNSGPTLSEGSAM